MEASAIQQSVRWILYAMSTVFVFTTGRAQDATVTVYPPVPARISDWQTNPPRIEVENKTTFDFSEFQFDLKFNGILVSHSIDDHMTQINSLGSAELLQGNTIRLEDVENDKGFENQIRSTGMLPEGIYELCLMFYGKNGNVTSLVCSNPFWILSPDPPMLLAPLDQDTLRHPLLPLFVWTPVQFTDVTVTVSYRLKMAPIFPGESFRDAMERNSLVIETDVSQNSYQYLPSDPGFDFYPTAVGFAWQVQALDEDSRKPLTRNEGKSEIWSFAVSYQSEYSESSYVMVSSPEYEFAVANRVISGTVRDTSNNPITGVRVGIHGSENAAFTDHAGEYCLIDAPVGDVRLAFSKPGYILASRITRVADDSRALEDAVLVQEGKKFLVGPDGDTLSLAGIQLEIPPGALTEPTEISITPLPPEAAPEKGDTNNLLLNCVAFGPDGLKFQKDVTVEIPLSYLGGESLEDTSGATIALDYFNVDAMKWVVEGSGSLSEDKRSVRAAIRHFSSYAPIDSNHRWYKAGETDSTGMEEFLVNIPCGSTEKIDKEFRRSTRVTGEFHQRYDWLVSEILGHSWQITYVDVIRDLLTSPACGETDVCLREQFRNRSVVIERKGFYGSWEKQRAFVVQEPFGYKTVLKHKVGSHLCCSRRPPIKPYQRLEIQYENGGEVKVANVRPGERLRFQAIGYDEDGFSTGSVVVYWSTSGLQPPMQGKGTSYEIIPPLDWVGRIQVTDKKGKTAQTGLVTVRSRD